MKGSCDPKGVVAYKVRTIVLNYNLIALERETWWVFTAEGWEYHPFVFSFLLSGCELPTDDPSWQLNECTDSIHCFMQFLFTCSIGISHAHM